MTNEERAIAPRPSQVLDPAALTFDQLLDVSERIAKSGIVPKAYRGNAGAVLAASLYGAELGLGPMASLKLIDVIDGKPTMSAQGMLALVRRAGHRVTGETSATRARVTGYRDGDQMTVEWTIEQARSARLVRDGSAWLKYPAAMLWARAVSQLCRQLYPDVLIGLSYTPEEEHEIEDRGIEPPLPVIDADVRELPADPESLAPLDGGAGSSTEPVDSVDDEPEPDELPAPAEPPKVEGDGGWEEPFGAALDASNMLNVQLLKGYVESHDRNAAVTVEATMEFLGNMLRGVAMSNGLPGPLEAIPLVIAEMEAWAAQVIAEEEQA